jgi:S1-C subfamily serine protease
MDRDPAGADGPAAVAGAADAADVGAADSGRPPAVRVSRRIAAAGIAAGVAALIAIAVLATTLVSQSEAPPVSAAAASGPSTPGSGAPGSGTLSVPAIYQRVAPSLVLVTTAAGIGTGVIVADNGTILTADHVVAGSKSITVTFADGTTASAAVGSADTNSDIATLVPARLPSVVVPANLGGGTAVGAAVVVIGDPLGLTDSVSAGVVSGLNRTAKTDAGNRSGLIQFDAAVNPGSSGSPLLDSRGLIVGIVVALADPDGQDAFAGIGFAVPIGKALGATSGGSGNGKEPQI